MTIIGAGGHAKVIYQLSISAGIAVKSIFDDDGRKENQPFYELNVQSPIPASLSDECVIAIGDNLIRKKISEAHTAKKWVALIHPTAIVSADVEIGEGTVVMAGAIIQADSKIGRHCIINSGSIVEHECSIGDFAHIATGAVLCGGVQIGAGSTVGAGARIIQTLTIGERVKIGAGSVVTSNLPSDSNAVGIPARVFDKR